MMVERKVLAPTAQGAIDTSEVEMVFALYGERGIGYEIGREVYIPDGIPYRLEKGLESGEAFLYINYLDADEVVVCEFTLSENTGWCEYSIITGAGEELAYEAYGNVRRYEYLRDLYTAGSDRFGWDNVG